MPRFEVPELPMSPRMYATIIMEIFHLPTAFDDNFTVQDYLTDLIEHAIVDAVADIVEHAITDAGNAREEL